MAKLEYVAQIVKRDGLEESKGGVPHLYILSWSKVVKNKMNHVPQHDAVRYERGFVRCMSDRAAPSHHNLDSGKIPGQFDIRRICHEFRPWPQNVGIQKGKPPSLAAIL